jgi:phosphonatase-like hydrolase
MKSADYALIVFDVAGTTVLDGDVVIEAMAAALSAHGVSVSRDAIRGVMGIPKPLAIAQLLLREPSTPNGAEEVAAVRIHDDFLQRLRKAYVCGPGVHEADGATETFTRLRAAGVKVALDTGFDRATLDLLLRRLDWSAPAVLDCSVSSDEVSEGRPSARLIQRAMQLTGVSDSRTVVKVGDTPSDIQSGRSAGCGLVVGVSYGTHTREELLRHQPAFVIDDLRELLPMVIG